MFFFLIATIVFIFFAILLCDKIRGASSSSLFLHILFYLCKFGVPVPLLQTVQMPITRMEKLLLLLLVGKQDISSQITVEIACYIRCVYIHIYNSAMIFRFIHISVFLSFFPACSLSLCPFSSMFCSGFVLWTYPTHAYNPQSYFNLDLILLSAQFMPYILFDFSLRKLRKQVNANGFVISCICMNMTIVANVPSANHIFNTQCQPTHTGHRNAILMDLQYSFEAIIDWCI